MFPYCKDIFNILVTLEFLLPIELTFPICLLMQLSLFEIRTSFIFCVNLFAYFLDQLDGSLRSLVGSVLAY